MNAKVKLWLMLSIILFISCAIATIITKECFQLSQKEDIYYYRMTDDRDITKSSLNLLTVMQDLSQTFRLRKTKNYRETNFLLFETLNTIDDTLRRIIYPRDIMFIYAVCGSDLLASKSMLANIIQTSFDENDVDRMIPKTYIIEPVPGKAKNDNDLLLRDFSEPNVYIMKQNIQRQEGNTLTNKLDTFLDIPKEVVCVQLMLQNPYLVNSRKINLRVYLLVVILPSNKVSMYMYRNGFLYYTPQPFKEYSLDPSEVITTGYIDRRVYMENPLTLNDLAIFMKNKGDDYNKLFSNCQNLMTNVARAYKPRLEFMNKGLPGVKFSIFGCDLAPDDRLEVKLIEINKGPDLNYKDERDKNVKFGMVHEAMIIAGMSESNKESNFISLLD